MRDTISQLCNLMVHTKAITCMRIWSNLRSAGHGGDDMHANLANPELLDCLTVQSDTKAENLVLRPPPQLAPHVRPSSPASPASCAPYAAAPPHHSPRTRGCAALPPTHVSVGRRRQPRMLRSRDRSHERSLVSRVLPALSRAPSAVAAGATRSTVVARFSSLVRAARRRTAAPQPAHTRLRGSYTHARERRTTAAAPNASLARPLSRLRVAAALSQHAVVPTAHETNAPSPQATDHDQCHQQPKCGYKSKHEQGRSANDCSYDRR